MGVLKGGRCFQETDRSRVARRTWGMLHTFSVEEIDGRWRLRQPGLLRSAGKGRPVPTSKVVKNFELKTKRLSNGDRKLIGPLKVKGLDNELRNPWRFLPAMCFQRNDQRRQRVHYGLQLHTDPASLGGPVVAGGCCRRRARLSLSLYGLLKGNRGRHLVGVGALGNGGRGTVPSTALLGDSSRLWQVQQARAT